MTDVTIRALVMPKLGLTMTEGTVTQWLVKQGTTIAPGTEVADIETTKITLALETEHAGTLRRIVASEGEILPVGAIIGVIAEAGVSATDIDRFIEEFQAKFTVKAAATAVGEEVTASFVDANGLRLRYLELGTGGIPILFVHGFGGDINSWSLNQALLARRRATYALDLPGHGGSSKDIDDGTVGSLASVVVDFMCALDIPNAHLVGHSLGGAVVMTIAREHAERAASLSLICSAGLGYEIDSEYIAGFVAAARRKDLKPVLERLFTEPTLVSRDFVEEVLKFKRLDGADAALRTIAAQVFPEGRQTTVMADDLREMMVPVQVIWGCDDRIIPVDHAERLRGKATVCVLEGGHMIHMEAAGEVNRLIDRFITDIEAREAG